MGAGEACRCHCTFVWHATCARHASCIKFPCPGAASLFRMLWRLWAMPIFTTPRLIFTPKEGKDGAARVVVVLLLLQLLVYWKGRKTSQSPTTRREGRWWIGRKRFLFSLSTAEVSATEARTRSYTDFLRFNEPVRMVECRPPAEQLSRPNPSLLSTSSGTAFLLL